MSSMILSGDTSGTVTVTVPAVAGTNTATLPAATGTVMVSGNMPAFSYYQAGTGATLANTTNTKITFDTKEYDTANAVSSSRFTPTVAGYYMVGGCLTLPSVTTGYSVTAIIFKNGSFYKNLASGQSGPANYGTSEGSVLVYLNGSTDYIELYGYQYSGGGAATLGVGVGTCFFFGCLVRAA